MKTIFNLLLFSTIGFVQARADVQKDMDSIKKMAGCYEVSFDFVETFSHVENYPTHSLPYSEKGTEYVVVDKDETGEVHLQHILSIPGGVMKHWRQEWRYEKSDLWTFKGRKDFNSKDVSLVWDKTAAPAKPGYWAQTVTQVDDSPRYECSAPWFHSADRSFWECKSPAPLPRREFTKRNDYDILDRRNRHEITATGWMHEQDNLKVISAPYQVIAEEKGYNDYKKIDDSHCQLGKDWWDKNKFVWNTIQAVWHDIVDTQTNLVLKQNVNGSSLWMELWTVADAQKSTTDVKLIKDSALSVIKKYQE